MKHLSEETLIALAFLFIVFFVFLFGFAMDAYGKYLDTYNTQRDREMSLKSYEIVLECRNKASVLNMDKICGEVPSFYNEVK